MFLTPCDRQLMFFPVCIGGFGTVSVVIKERNVRIGSVPAGGIAEIDPDSVLLISVYDQILVGPEKTVTANK